MKIEQKQLKEKVLIIKLGYSETLDGEIGMITSLGDVLRSTVLLHHYKNAYVTWLVDEKAFPLLKGNPFIHRILFYDLTTVLQLQSERFDTVINLEKVPGVCAFSDSINAWRRYGFRFDPEKGETLAYDGSQNVLEICMDVEYKKKTKKCWEEVLFEMVGEKWQGEGFILGYKPKSDITYDIGFNCYVGEKWPIKAWPLEYWKELESHIGNKYTISWQQGLKNLDEYIEWINSCRIIVTNDSLGLHIANGLGKKIIALFGPTISSEVYISKGVKLVPRVDYNCIPCLSSKCTQTELCMRFIEPKEVYNAIEEIIKA
ncbi:MAG: ADP-heptose-LPS-heptosyl transferase II [Candidatus Scalindua rubra]|uniref:ADP-heptose-LPS-heptosyl transferase II n=1 Tax=Candidatus Scalindua rubra TaxID=1872076 RepID=A0A1E3X3V6_9BACT|nr:MAG: ADP-heptose-LPS-heptosyl transferase II [Candidatus Scalindua rubra]